MTTLIRELLEQAFPERIERIKVPQLGAQSTVGLRSHVLLKSKTATLKQESFNEI